MQSLNNSLLLTTDVYLTTFWTYLIPSDINANLTSSVQPTFNLAPQLLPFSSILTILHIDLAMHTSFKQMKPAPSPFGKASKTTTARGSSANGSAFLAGVAVLEHPRSPKNKTVFFDAQLFMEGEEPLVAGLKYYNSKNMAFDSVTIAFIVATVSFFLFDVTDIHN